MYEIGAILSDVKRHVLSFTGFNHVRRLGNIHAHLLSKFALKAKASRIWIRDFPLCIKLAIVADLSHPNM